MNPQETAAALASINEILVDMTQAHIREMAKMLALQQILVEEISALSGQDKEEIIAKIDKAQIKIHEAHILDSTDKNPSAERFDGRSDEEKRQALE